jgi:RNA 3'-phosphate cyclase
VLEIDGSYGEGGGQILRNAAALSAYTKKAIKIKNIRANRPEPGLKAQHYVVLKSLEEIFNAETKGIEIGSETVSFKPKKITGDKFKFEIGTAGSITLVFQALILACLKTPRPITINCSGGTDVKWSPSWDYFRYVFLPTIEKAGVKVFSELILRGYYPKGGGEAIITINPVKKIKPLKLDKREEIKNVSGLVNISNLPNNISKRIRNTSIKTLLKNDINSQIEIDKKASLSAGVGITLWTQGKTILGTSVLGEKSKTSEEIGKEVVKYMISEIESESTVDMFAFDQILPYMAIAKKSTCIVKKISDHASTNMWLLNKFFDLEFQAVQNETNIQISVK